MDFVHTLLMGAYVYSTGIFLYLMREIRRFHTNHLRHAEKAINETRERVGLPPVKLQD